MTLGVVGGTGLYEMKSEGIAFISRHGKNHKKLPHEVEYEGIAARLYSPDISAVIGVSACGSMQKDIPPGSFVIPDQIRDRTNGRAQPRDHTPFAEPFCEAARLLLAEACNEVVDEVHFRGTLDVIQGPRFQTREEAGRASIYSDIVNMTGMPEAVWMRHFGIHYALLCVVTDYDSNIPSTEATSFELIKQRLAESMSEVLEILDIAKTLKLNESKCNHS